MKTIILFEDNFSCSKIIVSRIATVLMVLNTEIMDAYDNVLPS